MNRPAAVAGLAFAAAVGCAACGRPAPPATLPPRIIADFASGRVTLIGSLPDPESHDRLLGRAQALYGKTHVVDRILVDPGVIRAPWLATDQLLLPLVDNTISDGQTAFDGKKLVITGRVRNAAMKAQIEERTAQAAGAGVPVQNDLQVMQGR